MMAFKSEKDREAYVGKLKAAGFSPEEIDADVAEIEAAQPASAPVAPPPVAAQPNLQPPVPAEAVKALADAAQARSEQNQDLTGQVLGNDLSQAIKDLSGSNLGKAGLAVGAGYGLYKAGRLAERKFGQSGEVLNRIEPTMEAPKESARLPIAAQQSGLSVQEQAMIDKSNANRIAKEQDAARRAAAASPTPIPEPPAFIRNQPPVSAPITPVAPIGAQEAMERTRNMQGFTGADTPNQNFLDAIKERQAVPPAPTTAATPATATPSSETPTEAPKEKPTKKTGRPAASTLEPTTFRPDLGPGDNWLYNTAGPERRRAILAEFNEGKPAKDYKTAQELYKKYQEKYPKDMFGPVIPVDQAKARGIKPPENYGALGKVAKVGGVAGLALTAAELANAAQQSKKGNDAPLRESLFNLLGMVPGLGTAFTAGTYTGGTNEGEMEELARKRQMAPEITKR
jgi:hypothetical protein